MVRILEYGYRYVVTCPVCNAKLEYGIEDVNRYNESFMGSNGECKFWTIRGISCPVCGIVITEGLFKTEKSND